MPASGVDYYADLMPRGPAGCVRDAAERSWADTFVVADGTIVTRMDLGALVAAHHEKEAAITVVVAEEAGAVAAEPIGIYVISRSALEQVPSKGYQDIKEMLIPRLYEAGQRIVPYVAQERTGFAGDECGLVSVGVGLGVAGAASVAGALQPDRLGAGSQQQLSGRSARLIGPVVVGPGCVVEEGVTVLGPASLAPDVTVGRNAVVSRASVWPRCRIGREAFIDHSILTSGSRVAARSTVRDTVGMVSGSGSARWQDDLYWAMKEASVSAMDVSGARILPHTEVSADTGPKGVAGMPAGLA